MMLRGDNICLRPIREADLAQLYDAHQDIANRGPYFPWGVMSEATYRQKFQESGFWSKESGTLLIVTPEDEILGHVEYFPTVSYLDELELSLLACQRKQDCRAITGQAGSQRNGVPGCDRQAPT